MYSDDYNVKLQYSFLLNPFHWLIEQEMLSRQQLTMCGDYLSTELGFV